MLIDLHGHGKSTKSISKMEINEIIEDIVQILDNENIDSNYFMEMCLGNVVFDLIYENRSKK